MIPFPRLLRVPCATALVLALLGSPAPLAGGPRAPLEKVLQRVAEVAAGGGVPIVVFDLDDTVLRTSYRTKRVLADWAAKLPPEHDAIRAGIARLDPATMPYYLKQTLDRAGITDPALRKAADQAWGNGFFGSTYMTMDRAIRGAPEYVRTLLQAGARIVYLTARDAPRMRDGTLRGLKHRGFPMPEESAHVTLMMKPDMKLKDVDYKESVTARIRALGSVVASFDNEPRNLHMFQQQFPGAAIVYVDTPHSDDAPPLTSAMDTIADYTR